MAQADTSMAIADSITEQYAGVMDDLIADCTLLDENDVACSTPCGFTLQSAQRTTQSIERS